MKLYKVTFNDPDEGAMLSWHSSRAAAERDLRQKQRRLDEILGPDCVEIEDIPTDEAGLLRWLNATCTRNNG